MALSIMSSMCSQVGSTDCSQGSHAHEVNKVPTKMKRRGRGIIAVESSSKGCAAHDTLTLISLRCSEEAPRVREGESVRERGREGGGGKNQVPSGQVERAGMNV